MKLTKAEDEKVVDFLGQEIKIGDVICQGQRSGNTGEMAIYIVEEIIEAKEDAWREVDGKYVNVGMKVHRLKCIGGTTHWRTKKIDTHKAILRALDRVIVLEGNAGMLAKSLIQDGLKE